MIDTQCPGSKPVLFFFYLSSPRRRPLIELSKLVTSEEREQKKRKLHSMQVEKLETHMTK
jgi:hypothetical protein